METTYSQGIFLSSFAAFLSASQEEVSFAIFAG